MYMQRYIDISIINKCIQGHHPTTLKNCCATIDGCAAALQWPRNHGRLQHWGHEANPSDNAEGLLRSKRRLRNQKTLAGPNGASA